MYINLLFRSHQFSDTTGTHQPRNRPPRILPLLAPSLLVKALRRSSRRFNRPLHPLMPRHLNPSSGRRLQLHPRRRRLPRTICSPHNFLRPRLATNQTRRSKKTFQSMAACSLVANCVVCCADCCAFLPAQEWEGGCGFLLWDLCYCRHGNVSPPNFMEDLLM